MIDILLDTLDPAESNTERAVSPVIGVILMVAITVILAAVIGAFVIGLGDQVQETAPNAQFTFDYDEGNNGEVTITHDGGQSIEVNGDELLVVGPDGSEYGNENWNFAGDSISAGDSITVGESEIGSVSEGETIRVVWRGSEGTSATLATDDSPIEIT